MTRQENEFVIVDGNAAPAGGVIKWIVVMGARIRCAYWSAPTGNTKGTVVLLSGRSEFIEKYFEVIQDLLDRGYAIASLDWRGQGLSDRLLPERLKGYVGDFGEYDEDLKALMDNVVETHLPPPYHILAHSMGGHIALRYLRTPNHISSAVLLAPMTGIITKPVPNWAIGAIAKGGTLLKRQTEFILPGGADMDPLAEQFAKNRVTSDARRFERFKSLIIAEPKLALGVPTIGWFGAARASMALGKTSSFLSAIETPILLFSAGNDRIVDSASHQWIVDRLPAAARHTILGSEHEILMESDAIRAEFWSHFDAFLNGVMLRTPAPIS
jgi:lysophospholipase